MEDSGERKTVLGELQGRGELSIPGVGEAPGALHSAGTCQVTLREVGNQQHQKLRLFCDPETPS